MSLYSNLQTFQILFKNFPCPLHRPTIRMSPMDFAPYSVQYFEFKYSTSPHCHFSIQQENMNFNYALFLWIKRIYPTDIRLLWLIRQIDIVTLKETSNFNRIFNRLLNRISTEIQPWKKPRINLNYAAPESRVCWADPLFVSRCHPLKIKGVRLFYMSNFYKKILAF